jgi:hypothetical protein
MLYWFEVIGTLRGGFRVCNTYEAAMQASREMDDLTIIYKVYSDGTREEVR